MILEKDGTFSTSHFSRHECHIVDKLLKLVTHKTTKKLLQIFNLPFTRIFWRFVKCALIFLLTIKQLIVTFVHGKIKFASKLRRGEILVCYIIIWELKSGQITEVNCQYSRERYSSIIINKWIVISVWLPWPYTRWNFVLIGGLEDII